MTLADLLADMPSLENLRGLALVFDAALRERVLEVHAQYGAGYASVYPAGPTTDGRYYFCADILSETRPGGIYAAGFSMLDASRFDEIAVIPLADAVALLPADSP
jgi:hypothetical protein